MNKFYDTKNKVNLFVAIRGTGSAILTHQVAMTTLVLAVVSNVTFIAFAFIVVGVQFLSLDANTLVTARHAFAQVACKNNNMVQLWEFYWHKIDICLDWNTVLVFEHKYPDYCASRRRLCIHIFEMIRIQFYVTML